MFTKRTQNIAFFAGIVCSFESSDRVRMFPRNCRSKHWKILRDAMVCELNKNLSYPRTANITCAHERKYVRMCQWKLER